MVTAAKSNENRDLERRVTNFFSNRHVGSLRQLQVEADCGVVTIRGQVKSYYEKQLGQTLARHVAGVLRVVDEVEVE